MARCYNGSILHVDLSKGDYHIEHPSDDFYRTYGGGSAMGLYYILNEVPSNADPFGPENVLTLFSGIATGLPISGQSRLSANALSPLTNGIGDSQAGGFFPAMLKFAGFDGIVIKGCSEKPVYLYVHDGQVEFRNASHLWGMNTGETEAALKAELNDPKVEILEIGPSGEKLVRVAAIMNMCTRANGRTGMGAVMGSKRLKAIVAKGSQKMEALDNATIVRLQREGTKDIKNRIDNLSTHGTAGGVPDQNFTGTLPTFNFNWGQFEHFEKISGETMSDTILKERDTCFSCTVRCKRVVETEYKGQKVLPMYGGPEYETVGTLGSYCGVGDLSAISLANQLCNMYGLDTIGCGATVAFAMECFENGLLTTEDTGGVELRFGNADALIEMIEKINKREGIGNILAEGSARAAEIIGKNAKQYLITVKGAEAPAHMPQAKKSLGLIYAVNPFGADHMSHEHDPNYEKGANTETLARLSRLGLTDPQEPHTMTDEKVRFAYLTELYYSAIDSYNLCMFCWGPGWALFGPDHLTTMLHAATGWDVTVDEILQVGARRLTMMRAFNERRGFDRSNDVLPEKFFKPLQGTGPTAGVKMDYAEAEHQKDVYYRLAGWNVSTGNPTPERLVELKLGWVSVA